jgi:hypothetical protein
MITHLFMLTRLGCYTVGPLTGSVVISSLTLGTLVIIFILFFSPFDIIMLLSYGANHGIMYFLYCFS